MMGRQTATEPLFHIFCLEDHVPTSHPLRQVDRLLDLGFVREGMAKHYSSVGRPSIDPELMIRMLLIGYLQGIRSERRLVEEVHLNLAYRWFCHLGLDGRVPERSTFSKNRHGRFAEGDLFRAVFEDVVRRCAAAGIVPGESAAVDGSLILADANPPDASQVTSSRRDGRSRDSDAAGSGVPGGLGGCSAAGGGRADEECAEVPLANRSDRGVVDQERPGPVRLRDQLSGGHCPRRDLDVEATPARLSQEIVAAKEMLERAEHILGHAPPRVAADQSYGTAPFLAWLLAREIDPYIPVLERKSQTGGKLIRDAFTFDPQTNSFICPEGKRLTYQGADYRRRAHTYRSSPGECAECPIRASCTTGRVRTVCGSACNMGSVALLVTLATRRRSCAPGACRSSRGRTSGA